MKGSQIFGNNHPPDPMATTNPLLIKGIKQKHLKQTELRSRKAMQRKNYSCSPKLKQSNNLSTKNSLLLKNSNNQKQLQKITSSPQQQKQIQENEISEQNSGKGNQLQRPSRGDSNMISDFNCFSVENTPQSRRKRSVSIRKRSSSKQTQKIAQLQQLTSDITTVSPFNSQESNILNPSATSYNLSTIQEKKQLPKNNIKNGNGCQENATNYNNNKNSGQENNLNIKKKDNKKNQKLKLTQLKDLKPLNLEKEKEIFFEKNHKYNPVFFYSVQDLQFSIQYPHTKHMNLAIRIMNSVLEQYTTEEQWNEVEGGPILTQQETQEYFQKYIYDLGIQDCIQFEFQSNTISPTTCVHNNVEGVSKVVIGLPIVYRKNRIMGVLNHEIGTHFIRKYNDKYQKWYKHRKKYDMQNHSKVEEGLACINQMFDAALDPKRKPFLFKAALHYYASVQSSYLSFQDLFNDLEKYIRNPEDRWKECVRVKRGITDTQQKMGQYKDQIYLRGAVKVISFRHQLNFLNLHAGKITVKDCMKWTEKNAIRVGENSKFPHFLNDLGVYRKALERIASVNFLK